MPLKYAEEDDTAVMITDQRFRTLVLPHVDVKCSWHAAQRRLCILTFSSHVVSVDIEYSSSPAACSHMR